MFQQVDRERYVPRNFIIKGRAGWASFDKLLSLIKEDEQKMVLISAPPGMGKSRVAEEIHNRLVLSMNCHSILYVKLSQLAAFLSKWDESNPHTIEALLLNCVDESIYQEYYQRLIEGRLMVVFDGFDEICPHFGSHVISLIKELLAKMVKIVITSRPQENDKIIHRLKPNQMMEVEIKALNLSQKVLILQGQLSIDKSRYC